MILKSYIRGIYAVLLVGLITSLGNKTHACAAQPSYAPYIIPVALAALGGVMSVGWQWWTMATINNKVHLVAADVKKAREELGIVEGYVQDVQHVQGEHTQRLDVLQKSSDKNFKGLGSDLGKLKDVTEQGFDKLDKGQKEIIKNVDAVSGQIDRRFKEQAEELAQLKALVEQLKVQPTYTTDPKNATAPKSTAGVAQSNSSALYVHTPLFPARLK